MGEDDFFIPYNCDFCGEFACEIDHEEDQEDDSWFFDGSGMVGDD